MRKCIKCDGEGFIPRYEHINGGVCYDCDGLGLLFDSPKEERDYRDGLEEVESLVRAENESIAADSGYVSYEDYEDAIRYEAEEEHQINYGF